LRIVKNGKEPAYVRELVELYRQGKLPAGRLADVDVYHDDDCAIWTGGTCNCEPEVKVRPDRRHMRRDD